MIAVESPARRGIVLPVVVAEAIGKGDLSLMWKFVEEIADSEDLK